MMMEEANKWTNKVNIGGLIITAGMSGDDQVWPDSHSD